MEDKARFVVLKTLVDIEEKKAFSNLKLNYYFKKYDLNSQDRGFATELLYGTIRWKLRIDYLIQKFSKNRIDSISRWTLNCLRIAIYQIFFMDRVPEFAAVNESVELVKIRDKRASSFVNGILRNILRNKEEFNNINVKNKIKRLSIEYSHPEWFIEKFGREYDASFLVSLLEKNNLPPGLSIRVNSLKCKKEEIIENLRQQGVEVTEGRVEEILNLRGYSLIEKSKEYNEGLFTIQDESSALVAKILDPESGERVMDLCSAPGGKTTHIAQLMNNRGEILAFDIYDHKLELVKENAERLGIKIIKTFLKDSSIFMKEFKDFADKVLVDAPCSGLGLIRKKPEIRWNFDPKDILALQKIQKSIIDNAAEYVKPGGFLVYSTCTITREEDEDIIKEFLKYHTNYERVNICQYIPQEFNSSTCRDGYIKLFPNAHGTDGFFIAKLKRKW